MNYKNIEIKPCPFCGDSGFSVIKEGSIYVIQCGSCLCKTGAMTEKDVVEYWNSRPIEEALEEENARLRQGLFDAIDQNQKNVYELSVQSARGANYALKEIKKIEDENKKLREALEIYKTALADGLRATGMQDSFWSIVMEADGKVRSLFNTKR